MRKFIGVTALVMAVMIGISGCGASSKTTTETKTAMRETETETETKTETETETEAETTTTEAETKTATTETEAEADITMAYYEKETSEPWVNVHTAAEDDDKHLVGDELLLSGLLGKHSFIVAGNMNVPEFSPAKGTLLNMEEFYRAIDNNPITQFTLVDLDMDGQREAIVESEYYLGSRFVIHPEGDKLYLWGIAFRAMQNVSTDGKLGASGSAFDGTIYRIKFVDGDVIRYELYYAYYSLDPIFRYKGRDITEEEFNAGIADLYSNQCEFKEFTEDNVKAEFSK